jgi:phage FluMu gp28-like protein
MSDKPFIPLDLLLPYQQRFVRDASRFKLAVQSRQTGKSLGTAYESVEDCLTDPGTSWVCLSAGERQALEWMEKAREWSEIFKMALEDYAEDRDSGEALLKSAEVRFATGSRIIAIPANPSTARGYSANIVLDEFAYHEAPDKIWAAMFPSVSNPLAGTLKNKWRAMTSGQSSAGIRRALKIRVVSTFNGRGNKFFDLWDRREKLGFSGHRVTIHDAIADGLPLDAEDLRKALDNDEIWAQEYLCEPMDTSDVLLPYDLIATAESAEATEYWQVPESRGDCRYFAGVDFGRQNDPTVCWLAELAGGVLWTREVLVLKKVSTPDQQNLLESRLRLCERVSFDYTGPGIGMGDHLARDYGAYKPAAHEFGKIDLVTFTAAEKRLLFPRLRKSFEAPVSIRVPISRVVREDLHAMRQVSKNGNYNYEAPRTREGHSDRCTAAALCVRAAGDFNSVNVGAAAA